MVCAARADGIEAIRYASVRDPDARANVALLTCAGFADPQPKSVQSWRIQLRPGRAVAVRDFPRLSAEFLTGGTRLIWGSGARD